MKLPNRIFFTQYEDGPYVYWHFQTHLFGYNLFYKHQLNKYTFDYKPKEQKERIFTQVVEYFLKIIEGSFIFKKEYTVVEQVSKTEFDEIKKRMYIPEGIGKEIKIN